MVENLIARYDQDKQINRQETELKKQKKFGTLFFVKNNIFNI